MYTIHSFDINFASIYMCTYVCTELLILHKLLKIYANIYLVLSIIEKLKKRH